MPDYHAIAPDTATLQGWAVGNATLSGNANVMNAMKAIVSAMASQAETDAAGRADNSRDMDVAWLVICGESPLHNARNGCRVLTREFSEF